MHSGSRWEKGRHNYQLINAIWVVMDLGTTPLIDRELPPPGYWHSDASHRIWTPPAGTGRHGRHFEKPCF